jgi:hypothetical protein
MKTKRDLAIEQITLQEKIQNAGYNIVTCGSCGSVLLHELESETIECLCGKEMSLSDCPDYWYSGCEDNLEFNEA